MRAALLVTALVLAAPRGARADGADALARFLPDDASELLVIDIAHARHGGALGKLVAQLRAHSARWDAVGAAGLDLGSAIDTIVVAAAPEDVRRQAVIVVDGKVGPLLAHMRPAGAVPTLVQGVAVYRVENEELAIVDRHLVITSAGDMAATIARSRRSRTDAATHADESAAFRAMLAATAHAGADVRGGIVFTPRDRGVIAPHIGGEPLWAAFTIAASGRACLDVRGAFADEHTATEAATALGHLFAGDDATLLPTLQGAIGPELAASLTVEQDRAQVHITAAMSAEEADRLGNLLGSAL